MHVYFRNNCFYLYFLYYFICECLFFLYDCLYICLPYVLSVIPSITGYLLSHSFLWAYLADPLSSFCLSITVNTPYWQICSYLPTHMATLLIVDLSNKPHGHIVNCIPSYLPTWPHWKIYAYLPTHIATLSTRTCLPTHMATLSVVYLLVYPQGHIVNCLPTYSPTWPHFKMCTYLPTRPYCQLCTYLPTYPQNGQIVACVPIYPPNGHIVICVPTYSPTKHYY